MRTTRAFTLIEVVVALTIVLVLSAVGMGVFLHAQQATLDARIRAQMDRDAELLADAIAYDVSFLGAGVPLGQNGDAPGAGTELTPFLRLGRNDNLAFQGDLPYPNAELPGVVTLADQDGLFTSGAASDIIAVTSETSGSCVPPSAAAPAPLRCDTRATSLVDAPYGGGDDCTQAQNLARTCPWGLNKWPASAGVSAVGLTFVDSEGLWYARRNATSPVASSLVNGTSLGVRLDATVSRKLFDPVGGSFASTLDRVFWSTESTVGGPCVPTAAGTAGNCVVKRRQCWGPVTVPVSTNASYPAPNASAAITSATTPVSCDETLADPQGTGWETIVTSVKAVTFRYFTGAAPLATPLSQADKSLVRAIEIEIEFERLIPNSTRTLNTTLVRRIFLPNREQT